MARPLGCATLASVERPFAPDKGASIPGWRRDPAKLRPRTPAPPRDIAKPLASCRSGTQRRKKLLNFAFERCWSLSPSLSLFLAKSRGDPRLRGSTNLLLHFCYRKISIRTAYGGTKARLLYRTCYKSRSLRVTGGMRRIKRRGRGVGVGWKLSFTFKFRRRILRGSSTAGGPAHSTENF